MPQTTNLLSLLSSLPAEAFAEGASVEVERVDGQRVTITFGEAIPSPSGPSFVVA